MSPRQAKPKVQAASALVTALESMLRDVVELRDLVGSRGAADERLDAVQEVRRSFVRFQLNRIKELERAMLRPVAPYATWVDMPSADPTRLSAVSLDDRSDPFSRAFPEYRFTPYNTIINEDYVTVEYVAEAEQREDLRLGSRTYPRRKEPWQFAGAYVAKTDLGLVVQIDHYYDLSGILRQLGLMTGPAGGHDEPTGREPLVHGQGFVHGKREVSSITALPEGVTNLSVGTSRSAPAVANVENCTAIHESFVDHTPERFKELIAPDAVWIDVPTGVVLNGAQAAAEHDHGNWQTAFPDSDAFIDALIANDEWVTVQHRGTGTHTGPLQIGGQVYEPTGRAMEIRVLDIVQYDGRGGPCELIRNYYDTAMMMTQLGIPL